MPKPKDAQSGITIFLKQKDLDDIDSICDEAVKAVPGATLSRSAFVKELVKADLEARRAARQPAPESSETPAPAGPAAAPGKPKRAS